MTIGITDEHRELHRGARRWVETNAPLSVARAALDAEREQLPPFWADLAALGWLGLAVPERFGGEGFGLVEAAVVLEELGRGLVPGPVLPTMLAALATSGLGAEETAARLVPDLVSGAAVGAVAVGASPLVARPDRAGSRVVVGGVSRPVLGGAVASRLVLPLDDGRWVVLDRDEHALVISELKSLDPTRRLASVEVPEQEVDAALVLDPGRGARGIEELSAVLLAAEAVGLMAWCVEAASAYASDRVQFGRPIGQFQAVKHRCADMLLALEQTRAAAWDAARDGEAEEVALAAAVVGALAPEAAFRTGKDCVQVHGGIGFTWEHDVHLFLRRATTTRQLLGPVRHWRRRVADAALVGARRNLRFDLPAEAEALRPSVRSFLERTRSEPKETWNRAIADAGYLVPSWPEPWGLDADPLHQLVIDEEFEAVRLRRPHLAVGMWALPTIIAHGTPEQQERFIPATMRLELTWCQLFSEPGAGSDLAALATRADRVDGGWTLTGQKVWTTLAHQADWGICLARTDPEAPKHEGITCFLLDMRTPGIDIRPLRELTGQELFNEVFLDEVFVPDDCVVGEVGSGWQAARTTLANERVSMGSGSTFGPGVESVLGLVGSSEELRADAVVLDEVGGLVAASQSIAVLGARMTLLALGGHDAGAESSVRKLLGVEHEQHVQEVGLDLLGAAGAVDEDDGALWIYGFLGNRALSIAGGTSEVQRNVIAERLLGLPKDP